MGESLTREADHYDVDCNEALLAAEGIFKGSDQVEVVKGGPSCLASSVLRIFELVVDKGIR